MASLYEIDNKLMELINRGFTNDCLDLETGEIDEAKLQEYLVNLPVEREKKLEGYGLLIKNTLADIDAIKQEENNLADRRRTKEKLVERLKESVSASLLLQGETKFETAKVAYSFRKSETVEVENVDSLPSWYKTEKVTVTPDKIAIKQALKNGEVIAGCTLVTKQNIQIK